VSDATYACRADNQGQQIIPAKNETGGRGKVQQEAPPDTVNSELTTG